jgi:hypothetical protein
MPSSSDVTGRPDIARQLLGGHLRRLREASGVSRAQASRHIAGSESKISRMELGRIGVKDTNLDLLLTLYGVDDRRQRTAVHELARRLNDPQGWHAHTDVLAGWFCSYLVLESVAQHIRTYEVRFIPGLLQTEAYAEAVIRLRHRADAEIRRRIDVRLQRQRMVLAPGGPLLWAIVDEAALYEKIGSAHVMQEQIEFLIHATRTYPNVRIQILPRGEGGHTGVGNSFSMLRLRIDGLSDVVYLEQIESALFLDSPAESDPYDIAMNRLGIMASRPQDTTAILERAHRHISRRT